MKVITVLFILIYTLVNAQNQRFIYVYTFVKDSLEKDKSSTENMYLDITKNGSKYYSHEIYQQDSMMIAETDRKIKMGNKNFIMSPQQSQGTVRTVIEKNYPDFGVIQYELVGNGSYKITDDRKLNWKILPETMKIGEFDAQKAIIKMYGRVWTAWFCKDLPFQDGPHKFHGLPGLIIKIEDNSKSHIFELKGVKNLPKDYQLKDNNEKYSGTSINVNYLQYHKVFVENRENPSKSLQEMMNGTKTFKIMDQNGNEMDLNKIIREQNEAGKARNKRNNNLLELDLLK